MNSSRVHRALHVLAVVASLPCISCTFCLEHPLRSAHLLASLENFGVLHLAGLTNYSSIPSCTVEFWIQNFAWHLLLGGLTAVLLQTLHLTFSLLLRLRLRHWLMEPPMPLPSLLRDASSLGSRRVMGWLLSMSFMAAQVSCLQFLRLRRPLPSTTSSP